MMLRMLIFGTGNAVWVSAFLIVGMWKAGVMVLIFVLPIHIAPFVVFCAYYRSAVEESTPDAVVKSCTTAVSNKYVADETSGDTGTITRTNIHLMERSQSPSTIPLSTYADGVILYAAEQTSDSVVCSNKEKNL